MNLKKNVTSYGRFKTAPWFDGISQSRIMILGAGGIGSWLSLFLARTGANLIIVDMDTVEDHNLGGQLYGNNSIGKSKVNAVSEIITELCGENNITPINEEVTLNDTDQWFQYMQHCDVLCTSFDSIAARKIAYQQWVKYGKEDSLFIDGRMSMQQGQVFTVQKNASQEDFMHYEDTFFDDNDIPQAPCTAKATSHCGALIASLMTSQITNLFTNKNPESMPAIVENQINFCLPVSLFETVKVKNYDTVTQ